MDIIDLAISSGNHAPSSMRVELSGTKRYRLRANDLMLFARTLGGLLEGGVPILKALEGLEKAASPGDLQTMIRGLKDDIRHGLEMTEALVRSGSVPLFFHQTLYGGEISGQVPRVLGELSNYIEKEENLKKSVRSALVYPLFILAVGFVTLAVLTCYVLPKLKGVYDKFGTELPLITQCILNLSKLFLPCSILIMIISALVVTSIRKKGGAITLFTRMPLLSDLICADVRIRFSRLLALLLESGIPIIDALQVVERTFRDSRVKEDVSNLRTVLASGGAFSVCIDHIEWLDPLSRMLVVTGEETGRVGQAFFQIANDSEKALEEKINVTVKLIEPILVLVMGLTVGFVVIGTVLPIFDMSGVVH